MKNIIFGCAVLVSITLRAQSVSDTTRVLAEVTVRAYAQDRSIQQVPASVAVIQPGDLNRFVNTSLVPAFNLNPGVRLEERSPGSYRVAIRGSALRSPFGVRNVKVYWNDLPMTDAGGNTYLNQLDPTSVGQLEIIKGPGSSLYGAGTGGVLLFYQPAISGERSVELAATVGSFGLQTRQLSYRDGNRESSHVVQYLHQQSDGFRDHTRMARDMLNSQFRFELSDKQVLETNLLYSDLFYQTPGGLSLAEFQNNPRQARPPAGVLPGAQQQNAHVAQRSFFAGVSHVYQFSKQLHNRTGVYGNLVEFGNAAIRNWERRAEQNLGLRSITSFEHRMNTAKVKLQGGVEYQRTFSNIGTFQNAAGALANLQSADEIVSVSGLLFGQGTVEWRQWIATGGLSGNYQALQFSRLAPTGEFRTRTFPWAWMPRVALLRELPNNSRVHASISRGFSPPTLAEIRPSTTVYNPALQPETGMNYEVGWRGAWQSRISWDVSLYHFRLRETIVVRRDTDGADFFVNAGGTRQNGAEVLIHYQPQITASYLQRLRFTAGVTRQAYVFQNYQKASSDFSGNRLTGVPSAVYSFAADLALHAGWYLNASWIYTSAVPLDDANASFADSYDFAAVKAGWRKSKKQLVWDVFVGVDNAFNGTYSLGNDINAAGGRFFNAAPGRQFFGGARITFLKKETLASPSPQ